MTDPWHKVVSVQRRICMWTSEIIDRCLLLSLHKPSPTYTIAGSSHFIKYICRLHDMVVLLPEAMFDIVQQPQSLVFLDRLCQTFILRPISGFKPFQVHIWKNGSDFTDGVSQRFLLSKKYSSIVVDWVDANNCTQFNIWVFLCVCVHIHANTETIVRTFDTSVTPLFVLNCVRFYASTHPTTINTTFLTEYDCKCLFKNL